MSDEVARRVNRWFSPVILALSTAVLIASLACFHSSRSRRIAAAEELAATEQLSARLATLPFWSPKEMHLRGGSTLANEEFNAELHQRILRAARVAGVEQELADVAPGTWASLERTTFRQLPVNLVMERLTVGQVGVFLHHLISDDPSVTVQEIALTSPEDFELPRWSVRVTLLYLRASEPELHSHAFAVQSTEYRE